MSVPINRPRKAGRCRETTVQNDRTTGSFDLLATYENGAFMCASAGYEITCWGESWKSAQTFDFLEFY